MITLREEISSILIDQSDSIRYGETAESVEKILQIFKKRIDKISKPYLNNYQVLDLVNEIKKELKQ
ncbi:MAG TPA: hypothetical protein VF242_13720 [Nitrososphaeraceae archaeon]|jgi:hypothetical protein